MSIPKGQQDIPLPRGNPTALMSPGKHGPRWSSRRDDAASALFYRTGMTPVTTCHQDQRYGTATDFLQPAD